MFKTSGDAKHLCCIFGARKSFQYFALRYDICCRFYFVDILSQVNVLSSYYDFFFFFLGPYLPHMEVLSLGVESELQLPATATATPDRRSVCDLHHSSREHQIPNPLSEPPIMILHVYFFFFFFLLHCSMRKFLGQGLNPCHSS